MRLEMATKIPTDVKVAKEGCTDFVLHRSQQTTIAGSQKNIVDYTEHKLIRYATNVQDPQQKLVLMALITDYRAGQVAVAWRRGQPVYIRVTHGG